MNLKNVRILGLSGAEEITLKICKILKQKKLDVNISRFADGEILVKPAETVRNQNIIVVQSLVKPVNESVMELLICIDALKRASAKGISVVIPYYAYARQDRKSSGREPITAKLLAQLIEVAGADRMLVCDIHSDQTQGFFDIPFDSISATNFILSKMIKNIDREKLVLVSPDYGGVKRARNVARLLECPLAILDKRRPKPNHAEIVNILGDVKGQSCLIVDDMIDTGGTMVEACRVLKKNGAKEINIVCIHAILSNPAISRLEEAFAKKYIKHLYLSNSIPHVNNWKSKHLTVIDIGEYLAGVIKVLLTSNSSLSKYSKQFSTRLNAKI